MSVLDDEVFARALAQEWLWEEQKQEEASLRLALQLNQSNEEFDEELKPSPVGTKEQWTHPDHDRIPDVDTLPASLRDELPSYPQWIQRIDELDTKAFPPMLPFERDALRHQHMSRISILPTSGFPSSIEDLHFRIAESQVLRLLGTTTYRVVKVDRLVNPVLWHRYVTFCESHEVLEERLMFHGTKNVTIPSILLEGFKVGGVDVPMLTGARFGKGVYMSEDPSFALHYVRHEDSDAIETFMDSGSKCLLFAKCAVTKDSQRIQSSSKTLVEQLICAHKEQVLPFYLVYLK
jgi:hypothetical protein